MNAKLGLIGSILVTVVGLAACGGGTDAASTEVVLNVPDPAQPVPVDVTIGGAFEGSGGNPPNDLEPDTMPAVVYRDPETNSLSSADIAQVPAFDMDAFAAAMSAMTAAHPELLPSSNEFAAALIAELARTSSAAGKRTLAQIHTAANVFSIFTDLTPAERELVLRNPLKAFRSKLAADEAVAAVSALFTGSAYLTRADAFRHSYWNWLMSKCCTVEWATAFATAHESQTPNNDDKRMDLNNNMIGRRLYTSAPQSTPAAAQSALLNYKLLWINPTLKNVTVGVDYLVYLAPLQSVTVFDDGPSYDDIYTIRIAGKNVGDTPAGGSKAFELDQLPSGTHPIDIQCKLDGTKGGCGFEIHLQGALTLPSGETTTPQIVIQEGGVHAAALVFPTMQDAKEN